jgi:hypothetical protein
MMTTEPIVESGLTFGPFPAGHCFYIEKSKTYQQIKEGVKVAEFLLLRPSPQGGGTNKIWVVEAKSSAPKPSNHDHFEKYIEEIRAKLTNSLTLVMTACLKRHRQADAELSDDFKQLNLASIQFVLVLVIGNFPEAYLPPLQDALAKVLHPTIKTWALGTPAVLVINEDMARQQKLII